MEVTSYRERQSIETTFSISKSLVSIATGIALDSGWIGSVHDAITRNLPDLRAVALSRELAQPAGSHFQYNPYSPIVLGLALERASGRPLTQLLSEAVWSRIGAEAPASWSLDRKTHGFEKMESGFNATAIDVAKIGRLFFYVVPDRELIVVRTGRSDGDVNWVSVFERIVRRVDAVDARA